MKYFHINFYDTDHWGYIHNNSFSFMTYKQGQYVRVLLYTTVKGFQAQTHQLTGPICKSQKIKCCLFNSWFIRPPKSNISGCSIGSRFPTVGRQHVTHKNILEWNETVQLIVLQCKLQLKCFVTIQYWCIFTKSLTNSFYATFCDNFIEKQSQEEL